MKHWNDLTPIEQGDFVKGMIDTHGFNWKCYWKWLNRDTGVIEVYSEYGNWCESFSTYDRLNNVFDWRN